MKKIIINTNPWQTRVSILKDGRLQNIYFSSPVSKSLERSFFKGVVSKVLPGIQTAFVDIGQSKAGFLHISEIDRELAIERMSKTVDLEDVEKKDQKKSRSAADINKIFSEKENVLVQVSKEPVYEKGAKLTTCFTIPGRFLVLMPNIPRIAISKKIANHEERKRLKETLLEKLPEGMGAIIRTTCENIDKKEMLQDLKYLLATWKKIQKAFDTEKPQSLIYEDLPLVLRVVRDHLDHDVAEVVIDDKKTHLETVRFIKTIAPDYAQKIKLYAGPQMIFERYNITAQIKEALAQKVDLKSGGSIIIETAQAMTVIDVNTGKFTGKSNLEDTILKTNIEAAEETARQLRLRNIGGLIVIDFIDMATPKNRQQLMRHFEKALKIYDKSQSVVLKVSEFGLVQMTRKRTGKTLQQELTSSCACCKGLGFVKSLQTECYELLPNVKKDLIKRKTKTPVTIALSADMFEYISNVEYNAILELEKETDTKITLSSNDNFDNDTFKIK